MLFFSFYSLRILDFSHAFAGTISLTVKVKRTRKKKMMIVLVEVFNLVTNQYDLLTV